jgi:hypothetical protein
MRRVGAEQTQHGKRPPVGSWGYAATARLALFFLLRAVYGIRSHS